MYSLFQAALSGNQGDGGGWMVDQQQLKGGHKGNSAMAEVQIQSNKASMRTIAIVNGGEMQPVVCKCSLDP